MAAEPDQSFLAVMAGLGGVVVGAIGTAIGHIFKNHAAMSALVDSRIRLLFNEQRQLIDEQARRIVELQDEIIKLEGKVDLLTGQLEDSRRSLEQCGTCGRWIATGARPSIRARSLGTYTAP